MVMFRVLIDKRAAAYGYPLIVENLSIEAEENL